MHPEYSGLPAQATGIIPDKGCAGCTLVQTPGHKSCAMFRLQNSPEVTAANKIDLPQFRRMQAQAQWRAFIADGIVGSFGDSDYPYNASKAVNFAWYSVWTITSVSGDLITMTQDDADDVRSVVFSHWSETEQVIGYFRINGFYAVTCTQPGDMPELQLPSKANHLKCKILQVTAGSASSLTVKVDKDLSGIYNTFYPVDDGEGGTLPDPDSVTVHVYHYGRESEDWTYLLDSYLFHGRRTQKTIEAANLPENGIWELETVVVCPPESVDPLNDRNWTLEGFSAGVWTIISEDTRLHTGHTQGTRVALKTTLPAGSSRTAPGSDLTATYSRFRATYYVEADKNEPGCSLRGYDRCYFSRIDQNNSAGNYGATHGAGITEGGKHVYCHRHIYEEYEYLDEFDKITNGPGSDGIPDTVNVTLHHPTGLANFPTSTGKCIQYGYCNKYESSITHMGDNEAPFSRNHHMRALLELWFQCDKRRVQRYVLANGPTGYVVERIKAPGILWLNGYYRGLITPGGWHPQAMMRGDGTWFTKKPLTVVDQDGNETLMAPGGLEEGYLLELDGSEMVVAEDVVGSIPDSVSGFTQSRDPFTPGETVNDNLLEWIGAQIERDTGQIKDRRGLSGISMALAAETIVAPGFDLAVTTKQISDRATFEWDGTEGSDGILTILPYVQEGKPASIGSRVIHSVTSLGDHRYRIEFENTVKTFSRFSLGDLGTIGDSYDQIFSVLAGGGPCILPLEHQGLFSYDGNKDTGSRHAGAAPLDCIDINGWRFVIEDVFPHGGSEAATWGGRLVTLKGEIGGYYELPVSNDGEGQPLLPITDLQVKRVSDDQVFPILGSDEKPPIATEETWFDGWRRLYFSSLDASDYLEITYKDSAGTDYTQYFTIQASFSVTTDTDYSEYTGSDTQALTIGNAAATITVGGGLDPLPGEVRVDDSGGKIQLTFNINDGLAFWKLTLSFSEDAPEPDDDWAAGGRYKSFGKKRDAAIIRADAFSGGGDYFSENDATGETAEFWRSASVFLPKADLVLNTTVKTTDAWTAIPGNKWKPNAASGIIRIGGDYLATLSGVVCYQLPEIQMIDNRGQVPASIWNKTQVVLDAMNWVFSGMSGGRGYFGFGKRRTQYWYRGLIEGCVPQYVPDGPYDMEWGGSGNYFSVGSGAYDGPVTGSSIVEISVEANSFGAPLVINNLPDDVDILEAVAVISGSGITRHHTYVEDGLYDCESNEISPPVFEEDFDLEDISYSVIKYTSANTYAVIGSLPGAKNGTKVVDFTEIAQFMYANRKDAPFGYGLLFTPAGTTGESFNDQLPPEPPTRNITQCSGDCEGTSYPVYYNTDSTTISWGNAVIQTVAIKIDPKGKDKLVVPQPRMPSMADIPT